MRPTLVTLPAQVGTLEKFPHKIAPVVIDKTLTRLPKMFMVSIQNSVQLVTFSEIFKLIDMSVGVYLFLTQIGM